MHQSICRVILIARRNLDPLSLTCACGIVRAVRQLVCVRTYRFVESSHFDRLICLCAVITLMCSSRLRNFEPAVVVAHCESLLLQTACGRESSGLLFIGAVEHISASRSLFTCTYVCCHLGLQGPLEFYTTTRMVDRFTSTAIRR